MTTKEWRPQTFIFTQTLEGYSEGWAGVWEHIKEVLGRRVRTVQREHTLTLTFMMHAPETTTLADVSLKSWKGR